MQQKYLILKGCAGLGNRIFSILNALSYCEITSRKLIIDWSDGQFGYKNQNCFKDFFDINHESFSNKTINEILNLEDCYPKYWTNNINKSVYDLYKVGRPKPYIKWIFKLYSDKSLKNRSNQLWVKKTIKNNIYGFKEILDKDNMTFGHLLSDKLKNDLLIYADFIPTIINSGLINKLQLNPSLANEINNWSNKHKLPQKHIGLHIRYSDKKPKSSIDELISYIQNNFGDHPIFLATDNKEIEGMFNMKFSQLISCQKNLPDEVEGRGIHMWGIDNSDENYKTAMLKESIVDMWMLSKCKILFYQGNSSFSRISKLLHSNKSNCYDWEKL